MKLSNGTMFMKHEVMKLNTTPVFHMHMMIFNVVVYSGLWTKEICRLSSSKRFLILKMPEN